MSGLQALVEGRPPPLSHKLSWHTTLEKVLEMVDTHCVPVRPGLKTAAELQIRMQGLRTLEIQIKNMRISIAGIVSDRTSINRVL
jgi:hypothetical protein